jgi:hypothetical protein
MCAPKWHASNYARKGNGMRCANQGFDMIHLEFDVMANPNMH